MPGRGLPIDAAKGMRQTTLQRISSVVEKGIWDLPRGQSLHKTNACTPKDEFRSAAERSSDPTLAPLGKISALKSSILRPVDLG